jgi:thiamine biosynthesis protein ThiS
MRITINGETRDFPEGTTVAGLIEALGLAKAICAAEVNREIVPRDRRERTTLREGDRVEIVTLVGGG